MADYTRFTEEKLDLRRKNTRYLQDLSNEDLSAIAKFAIHTIGTSFYYDITANSPGSKDFLARSSAARKAFSSVLVEVTKRIGEGCYTFEEKEAIREGFVQTSGELGLKKNLQSLYDTNWKRDILPFDKALEDAFQNNIIRESLFWQWLTQSWSIAKGRKRKPHRYSYPEEERERAARTIFEPSDAFPEEEGEVYDRHVEDAIKAARALFKQSSSSMKTQCKGCGKNQRIFS